MRRKSLPDTDVRGTVMTEDFCQEKHMRKYILYRNVMLESTLQKRKIRSRFPRVTNAVFSDESTCIESLD